MVPFRKALKSQIGRKLLNGIGALALVGFVIVHLAGNVQLYSADGQAFNEYAKFLHDLGPLLYAAEIGLLGIFLLHTFTGIGLWLKNRSARAEGYRARQKSKDGPSNLSILSNNMIVSGTALLIFVVVHVLHFRFAAFTDKEYTTTINGEPAVDLYQHVVDAFQQPGWVAFYVGMMLFLGFHLRHGLWSMFQTLGWMNDRAQKPVYTIAAVLGLILAVGFLFIPIYLYFFVQ
jgi:succinate dehydrogenase / fumarate reductase cytochrome b subunit